MVSKASGARAGGPKFRVLGYTLNFCLLVFEMGSHEVALAGLELAGIDEASTEEAEADRQIPTALVGPPA